MDAAKSLPSCRILPRLLEAFGESVHLSPLVIGKIAKFQDLSGSVVAFEAIVEVADRVFCALVRRLIHLRVGVSFGKAINPRVEHLDAGFRAGHDPRKSASAVQY